MALLTVRAAADRLGIGYSTLKQWIYQGRIRTTHTAGGHHRIADAEVDRFVARQTPADGPGARPSAATGLIVALSGRNRLRGFVEEVGGTWALCYPYGTRNETTLRLLGELECAAGLTTDPRRATSDDPLLELPRIDTNDLQLEVVELA